MPCSVCFGLQNSQGIQLGHVALENVATNHLKTLAESAIEQTRKEKVAETKEDAEARGLEWREEWDL